jgi:hypothetical protein
MATEIVFRCLEFHNMSASSTIIRTIKSRRMIQVKHVTRLEEIRITYIILVGKPEENIPLET